MKKLLSWGLAVVLLAITVWTVAPTVAQNVACYRDQGGAAWHLGSGCTLTVESSGILNVASGGAFKIAGTSLTPTAAELNTLAGITATAAELNESVLTMDIADLSVEATYYLVLPHAGDISKIWSVIDGAVVTADVTLTCNIGATPITGGVVTIATAGSAAGDVDSATPSAARTVTAGQAVNCVVTGGGAGGTPRGHVSFVLTR